MIGVGDELEIEKIESVFLFLAFLSSDILF